MAKLLSISLLDEEISAERLMEALNKLSSRDLRKYFKRKKMAFPRPIRYAFLSKCIKRDFQAVPKDLLAGENRVFTEFELVEFYKCVENAELAKEFKKDFLAYFVKATYKNLLTDKNLAELYQIAESKEEASNESIHSFLVGLNPIFADTEENNLDCLPVETTAQRIKDQFTLFEVREFAKKYGVVVPKYPSSEVVAPVVVEKARAKQLLDEPALENLSKAEVHTLMSFAKKNRIYAPRYVKKDEIVDEVISQIASKEINNVRMNEVFNENLITFKSRSSSDSLCDLLDKYENLDDLSEVRNDNSKDMSPIKRCAVGGAIGLELKYNEETRKARLQARREKLEVLRQQALERKERLAREKREQDLINQRDASLREREEEEARRLAAEQRIAELEALLAQQEAEKEAAEAQLREEEEKRLALEKALEEAPRVEETAVVPVEEAQVEEEPAEEELAEEEVVDVFGADEIIVPEYVESTVLEEYETEEEKEVTYMTFETVEEEVLVEEPVEEPEVVVVPVVIEEEPAEEELPVEELPVEEAPVEEEPEVIEEVLEEEPIEVIEEVLVEEEPEVIEEVLEEEPIEVIEEVLVEEEPEVIEEVVEAPVEEEAPAEEETPVEEEAPAEEETPVEEEPKPEPVKCPVKKLHVKGWIWSILVVAAFVGLYFLEPFKAIITNVLANGEYSTLDYVGLYGVGFFAVGVVAFLVRWLLHLITCKAKKGKACCKIGEIYKYLWTHLIVAAVAVFAFMQAKLFHFDSTVSLYRNILSKIIAGETLALDSTQALIVIFMILIAAYIVTLLVCSFAHAVKCKKGSNPSVMRHSIIFLWSYVVVVIIATVALVFVAPQVLSEVGRIAVENVSSVLNGTALVVNAASDNTVKTGGPDIIALIFTALFAVAIIYILGLGGMTIGYAKHVKKQKAIEQEAKNENRDEVEELHEEETSVEVAPVAEETPVEVAPVAEENTTPAPAPVTEDKVVANQPAPVEEEGERLLFTTFEEAKLVEDLNDLNRMIGKVNEHVKDLSAIQARLYNELVGEEEIIIDPVRVEEQPVVIPEFAEPAPVVEKTPVEEPAPVEEAPALETVDETPTAEPVKVRPRCKVRRAQKVWWVLFAIALVAAAVSYFALPEVVPGYVEKAISALKDVKGTSWGPMKTIGVYGLIALAVIFVACVLRTLAHPVGCRVKKEKECRHTREFILYVWTVFILAVSAIVALYLLDMYKVKDFINNILSFNFAGFDKMTWLFLFGLVALVLLFVWLFFGSIRYGNRDKRLAKKAKEKAAKKEAKLAAKEAKLAAKKAPEQVQIEELDNSEPKEDNKEEPVEEVVEEIEKPKKVKKEKVKKEKKVREPKVKVNCPVRKTQRTWWIILIVLAVAAVACYFLLPDVVAKVMPYVNNVVTAVKDVRCNTWTAIDSVAVFGLVALAVLFVSFVLRTIAHPFGCKAKKERICTRGREFLLFLWTAFVLTIVVLVVFYYFDIYRARELAHSVIPFDVTSFSGNALVVFGGMIAFALIFVLLFIASIKTKANERRRVREAKAEKLAEEAARLAEEEAKKEEAARSQMQQNVSYFPMMLNGQIQMVPVATMNPVAPQQVLEQPKVEEKTKKEKKVREPKVKVNCPVRKTQRTWWIILVVVALLAAVALYFAPNTQFILKETYAALTDFDGSGWGRISKIGVYGVLVLAVLFLAFVWRTLVHPISCKAKKEQHCCLTCEFISYVWTVIVIAIIALAVLYYFDLYLVKHYVGRVLNVVREVLAFNFASFTKKRWLVFIGLIAVVIFAIWFIAGSIKHKAECRRLARYEADEAELNRIAPVQQPQMNAQYGMPPMMYPMQQPVIIYQQPMNGMYNMPQYNTGVYEDINSPYNSYRINDEPRGRRASKYHGKHRFLKFVFVVAVLAVAYVALAYFIKGLPGDDTIRNLVNRFIEIIK